MRKSLTHKLKPWILSFLFCVSYLFSIFFNHAFIFQHDADHFWKDGWVFLVVDLAITIAGVWLTKLHHCALSHVGMVELTKVVGINIVIFLSNIIICLCHVSCITIQGCFVIFLLGSATFLTLLFSYRLYTSIRRYFGTRKNEKGKRALIVGAGKAGVAIAKEILNSNKISYSLVGFIDDDPAKQHTSIFGYHVLGYSTDIPAIVKEKKIETIIIAIPSAKPDVIKELSSLCVSCKCEVKVLPGIYQLLNGQVSVQRLRDVEVNDLLGREPVQTNLDEVMAYIEGQTVLVTGGGGSIGSELCRQIASHSPKKLIIVDIYENTTYEVQLELKRKHPELDLVVLIASVRDSSRMDAIFKLYQPDIVFHAAAHKHVPLMESSPTEAVKNNIIGTYKLAKCAHNYGVKTFVQISTDKAVNPTNIMGATKRVCEMIIQYFSRISKTSFVAVRFGNVLGSNGSVIPLFRKQIEEGGPVTVTHKDIIRYFMTIPEAVSLVLQAGAYAKGGEIFVLDMGEQVKIYDLAKNLIRLSGYEPGKDIKIEITGLRPGEKLYEERLMAEEGLINTANDKISIRKPIDFDESKLLEVLDKLYDEAYAESEEIKALVKELVPTYQIYEEK
ncbi:MAG: polysaccharide biosynthesis protein [Ruminococcaceae bacterium]|nr:polysaccharide biosynthesis protein [Oscillospiraceae bacterium]